MERYRGVGYDEEALWLLGRAYVAASGYRDRARGVWSELLAKDPKRVHADDARAGLKQLQPGSASPVPSAAPGAQLMNASFVVQGLLIGAIRIPLPLPGTCATQSK